MNRSSLLLPVAFGLAALLLRPPAAAAQTVAALDYSLAAFDGDLDPWHVVAAEALRRSGWGTAVGRATLARRFDRTGTQLELDAYPLLGKSAYLYLNAGWSPSEIFPETRLGAEAFAVVAPGVEGSAGVRRLNFDARSVTLYTGSLAWYPRGHYLAVRPFLSGGDELLVSGYVLARRYLGADDRWVALVVGGGRVPGENASAFELDRLSSAHAMLETRLRGRGPLGLRASLGYEWEKLSAERERRRVTVGVGVEATL